MTMYPPTEEGYQDRPCNEPGCPTINDQGEGKGCACPGCKDSVQGNVGDLVWMYADVPWVYSGGDRLIPSVDVLPERMLDCPYPPVLWFKPLNCYVVEKNYAEKVDLKRRDNTTVDYSFTPTDIRTFETGATRDTDHDKIDPEGFLSPLVIKAFSDYMHENRKQKDGSVRASDNWQKGIPKEAYMKSGWRHFLDWWMEHRGYGSREGMVKALCGLMFNVMGYLHEVLKEGK